MSNPEDLAALDRTGVVESMYAAVTAGDMKRFRSYLSEDVKVHEAESLPFAGTFIGFEAFRNGVLRKLASLAEVTLRDRQVVAAGDQVLASMIGEFRSRLTGRTIWMPMLEIFTVVDGVITGIDVYYKDTFTLIALLEGADQ